MKSDSPIKVLLFLTGVAIIVLTSTTIVMLTLEILKLLEKLKQEGEEDE